MMEGDDGPLYINIIRVEQRLVAHAMMKRLRPSLRSFHVRVGAIRMEQRLVDAHEMKKRLRHNSPHLPSLRGDV